jgi:hypothetical protein
VAKEVGRDKAKRQELEQQSSQALLSATAAANTRAANAQETMANASKSVSQTLAAKALQDSLRQEREFVRDMLKNPVVDDLYYDAELKAAQQRVREYQSQLDELLKIIVKGVMPSSQPKA